jgi:hypothetical protein
VLTRQLVALSMTAVRRGGGAGAAVIKGGRSTDAAMLWRRTLPWPPRACFLPLAPPMPLPSSMSGWLGLWNTARGEGLGAALGLLVAWCTASGAVELKGTCW